MEDIPFQKHKIFHIKVGLSNNLKGCIFTQIIMSKKIMDIFQKRFV